MEKFGSPEPPQPVDDTDYAGTKLLVTWGREHVQPMPFQGMDIGPFSAVVRVLEGETPLETSRRVMLQLDAIAEEEYERKLPKFKERCRAMEKL